MLEMICCGELISARDEIWVRFRLGGTQEGWRSNPPDRRGGRGRTRPCPASIPFIRSDSRSVRAPDRD